MTAHPSFFELDRMVLREGDTPELRQHVTSCPRCAAHVERARAAGATPLWARRLRRTPTARMRRVWALGGAVAVAAAAVLFLLQGRKQNPQPEFTTIKGDAAVALHIKRGASVSIWDGRSSLLPGDAIRLEVAPAGFEHIAVYADSGDRPVELYRSLIANRHRPLLLPVAWAVDAAPGPEIVLIVLSHHPLSPAELRAASETSGRSRKSWAARLVLPKDLSGDTP